MSAVAEPAPMFATSTAGLMPSAGVEDRRTSMRLVRQLNVTLSTMGDGCPVECKALNISEGGMCVEIPSGCQLDVGQRVDVAVPSTPDPVTGKSAFFTSCYATVVRSTATRSNPNNVMLGLRFDHPFYL